MAVTSAAECFGITCLTELFVKPLNSIYTFNNMATQYNLILYLEIGRTKAAMNILIKFLQHFFWSEKGDNSTCQVIPISCFLIISPSLIKVLPLDRPRCKDHFALFTLKKETSQLNIFFHQGLQLIYILESYNFELYLWLMKVDETFGFTYEI